jgi:hypothetical protein
MIRKNVRVALYNPGTPGGGETPGAVKFFLPLVTK